MSNSSAPDDDPINSSPLCLALGNVPGLDPVLGLRHLRGREEGYARLLKKFAETRAAEIESMREHVSARRHAELARLAHNIKGIAGFLGALSVEAFATDLYAALREGREVEADRLAEALMEAQSAMADQILALSLSTRER